MVVFVETIIISPKESDGLLSLSALPGTKDVPHLQHLTTAGGGGLYSDVMS